MAEATETTTTTATTEQATATETKAGETTQATETKATESTTETKAAETTETKTAEETKVETKVEPVDYAKALSEVKMPEGMTLDTEAAKAGTELFAKHNLSAEAVKDLVTMYAQQQKAGAEGNAKAFATQVQGWKADAEKSTTAEERGIAKEAALKAFPKELVATMEAFGLTNRADFIKAMGKVGKAMVANDTFVPGNAGAANGSRDARAHFPNSNMNP